MKEVIISTISIALNLFDVNDHKLIDGGYLILLNMLYKFELKTSIDILIDYLYKLFSSNNHNMIELTKVKGEIMCN